MFCFISFVCTISSTNAMADARHAEAETILAVPSSRNAAAPKQTADNIITAARTFSGVVFSFTPNRSIINRNALYIDG